MSVATPDYILEMLREGNWASHNDGGNNTEAGGVLSSQGSFDVDNLQAYVG